MNALKTAGLACLLMCGSAAAALADDCSGRDHTAGTILGAMGGAAIGGAASHNAGGAVAGAVVGGLAGNAIARSQDCDRRDDRRGGYDRGGYGGGVAYQPSYIGPDENDYWTVESYDDFNNDYRHIWALIRRGREDGSLSRYDADRYSRQLQQIRRRADYQQRTGRFDPEDIEAQLTSLRREVRWTRREGREDNYYRR
jgi:osmotically inducible lipoprotein OsmB